MSYVVVVHNDPGICIYKHTIDNIVNDRSCSVHDKIKNLTCIETNVLFYRLKKYKDDMICLDVGKCKLGDYYIRGLITCIQSFDKLSTLFLNHNILHSNSIKYIATLQGLTTLDISNNQFDSIDDNTDETSHDETTIKGIELISRMKNLSSLSIAFTDIDINALKAISSLDRLTHLDVGGNSINADGFRVISKLTNLTSLNIAYTYITLDGVEIISSLQKLIHLDMSHNHNNIGANAAKYISTLRNLQTLDISGNIIGDEGAKYISSLCHLTDLIIRNNRITRVGVKYISTMYNVTRLELVEPLVDRTSVRCIATMYRLKNLVLQKIDEASYEFLTDSLLKVKIQAVIIGVDYAFTIINDQKSMSAEKRKFWKCVHYLSKLQYVQTCIHKCIENLSNNCQNLTNINQTFSLVVLQDIVLRQLDVEIITCEKYCKEQECILYT